MELKTMRNLIAAALLLSPLVLAAQTNNMQARLATTAYAAATNTAHPTAPVRVSTGVVAPKLIHVVDIQADDRDIYAVAGLDHKVTVSMIVDANGTPNDLKIVQTDDAAANQNVLAAVSQYRFKPGTLSNQPTAVPVNLEITVRPTR
jgi:TonB family protein